MEEDEELDIETLEFFEEFVKMTENEIIKEKIEKILIIVNTSKENQTTTLSNKLKNEILKNLKEEYLLELNTLNSNLF
jgi:hypothetical protein